MGLVSVILVIEDRLSDAVSTKILQHFNVEIVKRIIYEGNSYLQRKAQSFNQAAHEECGIFMLTDLDSPAICPPSLIQSWVKGHLSRWFFLRVAVMEVESWIMADREAVANFLEIPTHRIPTNTDEIPFPKEFLVSLARRSKKQDCEKHLYQHKRIGMPKQEMSIRLVYVDLFETIGILNTLQPYLQVLNAH